ncbi:hypothetical protein PILCRDRAFT_94163 [Piloderma croceum F 1598]|uniref:Glycosyltransferase 61 catalytic domain-containing protein n=1 Tax=Piloderma croceum (strain F 1598) TaxID=765440 RepID=A0A0C3CQS6_PILCF|nr:hypothetical protein PILCRDRAFT_94163 [Piloderma croceum F 1598]
MTRRDAILILLGAISMQIFSSLIPFERPSINISTHSTFGSNPAPIDKIPPNPLLGLEREPPATTAPIDEIPPSKSAPTPIGSAIHLPETSIVSHAPGWTLFRDIYMANGTLFILSSSPKNFPPIRDMTSTGLEALNTPENIAAREPTKLNMDIITPEEAQRYWGGDVKRGEKNRVWSVEGNTMLFNDPGQFLNHYYHFVGELLLGTWAFWQGAFSPSHSYLDPTNLPPRKDITSTTVVPPSEPIKPPPVDRIIFAHARPHEWRDHPGFNAYFLRAAFPSVNVETEYDWKDRVDVTFAPDGHHLTRAWHFPTLLLTDRSAAFRGQYCGSQNQRIVSEAVEKMRGEGRLARNWWESVRRDVLKFAGADTKTKDIIKTVNLADPDILESGIDMAMPKKIVITYISRQDVKRRLIEADHEALVKSLRELVERKNSEWIKEGRKGTSREWELNVVKAEQMTKDNQIKTFGRTSILLGVHGNGLTHLVLMARSPITTVIEMFYPKGFAHDYEWTAKALGMKHFGIWNDTYFGERNMPNVDYPDGFQGTQIPVFGPTVAKLIEDRVAGLA